MKDEDKTKVELIKELKFLRKEQEKGVFKDSTERKQAEEALRESEEKYRAIIEQSIDGIMISDQHAKVAIWNKGMESITGIKQGDAIGKPIWETQAQLIPKEQATPEFLKQLQIHSKNITESKIDWPGESREQAIICADGTPKVVQDSSFTIKTADTIRFGTIMRDITEKKEKQLQDSEQRLNTLISQTPAVIYSFKIIDGIPKITYINENIKHVLGFEPEDFIDNMEFWASCVHPEDMPKLQEKLSGKDMINEYRFKDKKGNYHWLHDERRLITHEDGTQEVIGAWWDVTERKVVEDKLKESEERLNLAMDAAEHGFWDWNLNTDEIYFSPRYYTMLGYNPGELPMVKDTWTGLMHPKDRETIVPKIQKHVENAEPYEVEFRLKCKDGTWKWISGRGKSFEFDKSGKPQRAVGVHVDITERKQTEEEIRKAKSDYLTIVNLTGDIIVTVDVEGRWTFLNDDACEFLGKPREVLLGVEFADYLHPDDVETTTTAIQEMLKTKQVVKGVINRQKTPKGWRIVEWNASPILDETGNYTGMQVTGRDITERKQMEEALRESEEKFRELDQLKSMFIASMSHELRTPLNSIIGFTGVILQGMSGEINAEQKKQLSLVKNSGSHLLSLINDIIDISKIEAGKVEIVIEEFDLSVLAQEIKDSFTVALDKKELQLLLQTPQTLLIKTDKRRTEQILVNFISNALKFTYKGEIEIKIVKKEEIVEVSVRDSGIGIKKKDMDKLFKTFSRISTLGRIEEGTGLGLYLSKKIADLLGGDIKAESEFGKGSVFTLTLPLKYKEEKV